MGRCSSFTSHSFGKLRCFSIQKVSAEGCGSIGNPKLHPLRDLEVAPAQNISRRKEDGMPIKTIEVQRFSLTTSRSFEAVVASLKAGVGRLDLAAFASASKSSGHLRRVGGSDQPKHGGIRSDVVLGIRSRCRRSEGNRTRETEDHEASDRQSSSHEGNGQACSGRGVICACDRAR